MTNIPITPLLEKALISRASLIDPKHESAFRLFNGFIEGCPELAIDVYASTVVIHNYADDFEQGQLLVQEAHQFLTASLNWLRAGIIKTRNGTQDEKRGMLLFGTEFDRKIKEHDTWYAIDPILNRDASFYLDTRFLRKWIIENLKDKTVLNTFAYTGSFGVAALKGGASRVVQIDLNREFLNLAKSSYTLNGFPIRKGDFIARDFFEQVSNMKRTNTFFDCVLIDPPFFSSTSKGRVDQVHESARLINKIRPLINDGGFLIAINNALFVSGDEYMQTLESLCKDGYLKIRELIPVPEDFTGYPETRQGSPVTNPAPFNHSTKIAILDVKRK
ncbi:class I SAM-dependent methyltransferase [Candidatus Villigracilis affinis]|uniref:class I SAM-dependent methyltransferase n=1 Tax=Candidatus Villigracilis affinis TaxID=3140682 RepID=UPI001B63632E|nr:class I SAM-dependent methyltransferase [Anaerolineales bacterium]MBP8048351.1 class I SAM-dependent methyltransferase [Anaerolineales bacterium]